MEFKKLSAPSLKDLFVRELENAILSESLPIGAKLPPERELAAQMQVSRTVVNAGVAELAQKGFLEVSPRQGTVVADYRRNGNMNTLIAIMDYRGGALGKGEIRAILEVRRALEHLAAVLVIKNASDEALVPLARFVDELGQAQTPADATQLAFQFHHELAFAGGNSILPLIYTSFRAPIELLWQRFCRKYGVETLYQNTARLFEYIRGRDEKNAAEWIDLYLGEAIEGRFQIYLE